jgi:hypothetical protein
MNVTIEIACERRVSRSANTDCVTIVLEKEKKIISYLFSMKRKLTGFCIAAPKPIPTNTWNPKISPDVVSLATVYNSPKATDARRGLAKRKGHGCPNI